MKALADCAGARPGSRPTSVIHVIVRGTAKALALLGRRPGELVDIPVGNDDWYLNLLWFERRKCLLASHAETMFSVFIPDVRKRDLGHLGPLLVGEVRGALETELLPLDVLGPLDPAEIELAKTSSKRTLALMNDTGRYLRHVVHHHGGVRDLDVIGVNRELQRLHHGDGRGYATPLDLVAARLR